MRKHGVWMESMKNDEILEEVDKLVSMIKNSDSYQKYESIKEKMKQNDEINQLITLYKNTQKQLVKATYEKRREEASSLERVLQQLEQKLNNYPIYVEYSILQEDLDQLFQQVKSSLENYFNESLNGKRISF